MTQSKTSLTPVSEETPWKDAVEEACIVNHLQIYPYDAKKTLANLINWEVLIALDPKVSKAAQDLFDAGAKSVVAAPQHQPAATLPLQETCPSCQASDHRPYIDAQGQKMRACGRCMIQWVTTLPASSQ